MAKKQHAEARYTIGVTGVIFETLKEWLPHFDHAMRLTIANAIVDDLAAVAGRHGGAISVSKDGKLEWGRP